MASISRGHIHRSCVTLVVLLMVFRVYPSLSSSASDPAWADNDPAWADDTLLFLPGLTGENLFFSDASLFDYATIGGQENAFSTDVNNSFTDRESHGINSQPGMKLQLSSALLNTLATYATNQIFSHVMGMKLPDQRGNSGGVKYEFCNMKVVQFSKPSISVSTNPGSGLTIVAKRTQIKIDGRFSITKLIKLSGKFDLFIEFNFVTLSFAMGADSSGRPTIWSTACRSQIGTVTIKFYGGAAWIVDFFKKKIVSAIKNDVSSIACKLARNGIDVSARAQLAKLPLQYLILSGLLNFDYRLWSPPSFDKGGFIETRHKAEVFYTGDSAEAPFQADALPEPGAVDRMVTLWVSEYTFNTAAYALYRHGLMRHIIHAADLPPADRGYLNTTCTQGICFGQLFPVVSKLFPNSVVELALSAGITPSLIISTMGVDCLFSVVISFDARLANNSLAHLFEVNFTATVPKAQVYLNGSGNVVRFSVDKISAPTVAVVNSAVGPVSVPVLTIFFIQATKSAVPMINKIGGQGYVLPQVVKNWKLDHVGFNMDMHCVRFATNITPL